MNRAKFVTIEGCDGSGKTTQIKLLQEYFQEHNINAKFTREPGGTILAERIRQVILDSDTGDIDPGAEFLLYTASRLEHISKIIKPSLESGQTVICDRFVDSSMAYQGFARGLGIDYIEKIFNITSPDMWPDLTIFLDVIPSNAYNRQGDEADRIEKEGEVFQNKVYEGYSRLAKRYHKRIVKIDGTKSVQEVFEAILKVLRERKII